MKTENSRKTIWIADDDEDDCLMIKDAFIESNYKEPLMFFNNGEEVIEQLKIIDINTLPSLILLDLNMPKVGGHDVLSFIKENEATKNINVVILSTSKNEEDLKKAFSLGANDFITKPYQFNEMLKIAVDLVNVYG